MPQTQAEFIAYLKRRPALKGSVTETLEDYITRALLAVSSYSPRIEKMCERPADAADGIYSVAANIRRVTDVWVSGSNVPISYEVKDIDSGGRQLWLYGVRLPSAIGVLEAPGLSSGTFTRFNTVRPVYGGGSGYTAFDMEYSMTWTYDDLRDDHFLAIELYCEYLGYEERSVSRANLTDIEDREASGASTTFRRSQATSSYVKLMAEKKKDFLREVRRPYWTRSGFGIIERLWADHGWINDDALYVG